jgi:hypothetical protein
MLDCKLVTPGGHPVEFSASIAAPGVGTAVLEPTPGTVWPAQRLIGGGGAQNKGSGGIKSRHHIGGDPGVDLEIDGERATLLTAKKLRSGLPRAYGFCLPRASGAGSVDGGGMVATNANATIPAFDPGSWPEDDCAVITRSGRRGRIDYTIAPTPAQVQLTTSEARLLDSPKVSVPRVQANGGRGAKTRFGGKSGASGGESLLVDRKTSEAVQLIDFDRLGTVVPEPAAAICGHSKVVRRPMMK